MNQPTRDDATRTILGVLAGHRVCGGPAHPDAVTAVLGDLERAYEAGWRDAWDRACTGFAGAPHSGDTAGPGVALSAADTAASSTVSVASQSASVSR